MDSDDTTQAPADETGPEVTLDPDPHTPADLDADTPVEGDASCGRRKKDWSEMSPGQRTLVVLGGIIQIVLLVVAARDLVRRPADEVRGPKWAWIPVLGINGVGPVTYLVCGRRRHHED